MREREVTFLRMHVWGLCVPLGLFSQLGLLFSFGHSIWEAIGQILLKRLTDCRQVVESGSAEGAARHAHAGHGVMETPEAEGMPTVIDRWLVEELEADSTSEILQVCFVHLEARGG